MSRKYWNLFCVIGMAGMICLAGCAEPQEADAVLTETPVPTIEAMVSPEPTEANTPMPTATPEPTATNTPVPTATPEPTATNTPVPTTTPTPTNTPTPSPTPAYTFTEMSRELYVKASVNVRSLPSTEGTKLGQLKALEKVAVTGQCKENGWYRISFNGEEAYVSGNYLVEDKPTPSPTPTPKTSASSSASKPSSSSTTSKPRALPTSKPIPPISEIEAAVPTQAPGHVYTCSERGEEALEAAKALREKKSGIPIYFVKKMREEYDFSEEDVLYAVYNSGWKEKTVEWSKSALENKPYSRVGLINYFYPRWPFIEADVLYGVDNCGADWNEQAIRYVQNELDKQYGCNYISLVKGMKREGFTNENIEYALTHITIDWVAEAEKNIASRLESNCYSEYWLLYNMIVNGEYVDADLFAAISNMDIDWAAEAEETVVASLAKGSYSRQALIETLVNGDGFAEDIAVAAVDKADADWVAEAMEKIDYDLKNYTRTKKQCLDRLQTSYGFTKEEAEAAIANRTDIDWKEQAVRSMQNTVDKMAQSYDDLVFNFKDDCSPEELEYALNHIVVDWDEEARQKAEGYINSGHDGYSPEGLVDHMMSSHGFTKEQCVKAVESLGDVDWNEQAVTSMRWFMKGKHSREDLIEILRRNKFTEDQIAYALKVCNPK